MNDEKKAKGQLIKELRELRQHLSELEQAETKSQKEKFLHIIGENSTELVSIIGLDGKHIFVSSSYRELGYDPDELIGSDGFGLLHPEDRKQWLPIFKEVLLGVFKEGDRKSIEVRVRDKAGKYHYVESIGKLIKGDTGFQILSVARDITERKRVEKEISDNRNQLDSVFRVAPIGIGVVIERKFQFVNKYFLGMLGYEKEEELVGQLSRIVYPSDAEFERVGKYKYDEINAIGIGTIETVLQKKDGSTISVLLSSTPLDPNDLSQGVTFTALDITEQAMAEQEILERTEDLALINAINAVVNCGKDLETIIRVISDETKRIFACQGVTLYLLSDDKKDLVMQNFTLPLRIKKGIEKIIGRSIPEVSLPLEKGEISQSLLQAGKPKLLNTPEEIQAWMLEFAETPQLPDNLRPGLKVLIPRIYKFAGYQSVITIPLILDGEPVGLMDVSRREPFTEADADRIARIAGQLTAAIRRLRADQALQKSAAEFRLLADHTFDWEYWVNPEGEYVYISPACERITGYTREEFNANSKLLFEIADPEYKAMVQTHYEGESRKDLSTHSMEFPIKTREGKERWLAHNCIPLFDEAGDFAGRRGNNRDITERVHTEAQLKLQGHALEAAANAIVITDIEGNTQWVNSAFCTLTGHSVEEVLGQNLRILKSGQHDDPFYKRIWDTIVKGEVWSGEIINKRKDGRLYTEEMTIAPLIADNGQVNNFIAIKQDITERKETEEAAKRYVERLRALRKIEEVISNSLDLELTLRVLLDYLLVQLDVDAATVLRYEKALQELTFSQEQGFHTAALKKTNLRLGDGYAGKVALKREDLYIPDLQKVENSLSKAPLLVEESFIAYYGVPLIAKGTLVGVLEIFNRSSLAPNDEWVSYLHTLAGQAAIAIDNISLFNDLQRSNTNLFQAYNATIEGWAQALELRDMETEGHSRRVVDLTTTLAKIQGIRGNELVNIQRGALLHDIGKMGVPDAILQKPGKLSPEEWENMKLHPVYAFEWLSSIEYLRPALDIPHYHHEKWDGTGYPHGLKGNEIPLPARIFAIVDVWDALLSDRPYRKAWSREKTLTYNQEESGKYFDPEIVTLFLEFVSSE